MGFASPQGTAHGFQSAQGAAGTSGGGGGGSAPTLSYATSPLSTTGGGAVSMSPTVGGSPAPTFTVLGGALPTGVTLNASSGLVSGTMPLSLLDNLSESFDLQESSGDAVGDHAGLVLTMVGTVGSAAGPGSLLARSFDQAAKNYLWRASTAALQTGDIAYSIEVWARLTSKTTIRMLASKGSGDGTMEFHVYYDNTSNRFTYIVFHNGAEATQAVVLADTLGSPALDTWYQLICRHDPVANTVSIQVNGGAVDTATTGTVVPAAFTGRVFVGAFYYSADNTDPGDHFGRMDGRIALFRLWKRGLTTSNSIFLDNGGSGKDFASLGSQAFTSTIRATNASGHADASLEIDLGPVPLPPEISYLTPRVAVKDIAFAASPSLDSGESPSYYAMTTGAALFAADLPQLAFNTNTGVVSGTPSVNSGGAVVLGITPTGPHGEGAEAPLSIDIRDSSPVVFGRKQTYLRVFMTKYLNHALSGTEIAILAKGVDAVDINDAYLADLRVQSPTTKAGRYDNKGNVYDSLDLDWLADADANGYSREAIYFHARAAIVGTQHGGSTRPVTWFWAAVQNATNDRYAKAHDATGFSLGGSVNDECSLGFPDPFREVNVDLSAAASGGWTFDVQYCSAVDGSKHATAWTSLTLLADTTSGLTVDGKLSWEFPGSAWKACRLVGDAQGEQYVYAVRIRCTHAGTGPTIVTLTGRDYCGAGITDAGTWTIPVFDSVADVGSKGYLTSTEYAGRTSGKDAYSIPESRGFASYGQMRFAVNCAGTGVKEWARDHAVRSSTGIDFLSEDNSSGQPPFTAAEVLESVGSYTDDYRDLMSYIFGSNPDGTDPVSLMCNVTTYSGATPISGAQGVFDYMEFAIRGTSANWSTFLDTNGLIAAHRAVNSIVYMVLDAIAVTFGPTTSRAQLGALAWYLLVADPEFSFFEFDGGNNPATEWQDNHWFEALTWVGTNLGAPTNAYSQWATGADPENGALTYKVYRRDYAGIGGKNVIVVHKPLSYTQGVGDGTTADATVTTHALGASYKHVLFDGTLGAASTDVLLRNGEGAVLVLA